MLTATTKSLLSPIADAVSQLIVITAQAELNGSPIPDLRDVAQLVAQHVYSLAEIGHGLIDPAALAAETRGIVDVTRLLKDMTDACAEVRAAGDLLVSVTQTLASDPFSAAGRKQLVEATKGILQGTQRILNTYDDSEIQKSLVVARALVDQSKLITTILGSDLDSPPVIKSLLDNARTFAQQSVFLFHLVHARIPELLSPPIQRALTHHSNALDRAAVGTIAALKYALAGSHQIVPANVDLVKRQLKVHARACEGIAQYIVKDDMPEGALGDIIEEEAEQDELSANHGTSALASLTAATAGSRRSLASTSKARIDPVRARIKRYVHALESLAEGDELEVAAADAMAAVQQAQADIDSAPWARNNKQPQIAVGLLAHAIQDAQGAPKDLHELHAKRIQGIADHLAKQVDMAAVMSQHEAIGAVLSALDQVSECANELDAMAARESGASDPSVVEAKADELQAAGQAAVQGLKALGLVRAANPIQGSVPTVVSVARSMAESANDPTAQEANRAYLGHVLGELSGQVDEAREQVIKSVSGDEVVLGLVSHIAENLQAIEASRAKGAASGNLDRAGASVDRIGTGNFDSAAIDKFMADCGSVAKDMQALNLSEQAESVESSAKMLADAANALLDAKKTKDPAQIKAAQDLLDASVCSWNATLANSRRVVAQQANTDSALGQVELCKEKAIALCGSSKAGFADADQDFARATENACQLLTESVNLPTHADELATLATQVSLMSRAAVDAADGDAEEFKKLATQRNAAISQFNAAIDKLATHLNASTRERALGSAILHIDQAKASAPAIRSAAHGGKPNPIALNKFLHDATAASLDLKAAGALGSSLELDTAISDARAAVRDLQATDDDANSRAHKFASSRLDVALEQWSATADKVRKQAVQQAYQTQLQGVVAELEAAKTSVAALASEGGQNGFKKAAGLAAQALSDIGRNEDATELKDKAKSVVEAAKELTTAKASANPDAAASSAAKLQRLVRDWNQVVTRAQEGATAADPADTLLSVLATRAMEAAQSQPIQSTGVSNLDRSQILANSLDTSPNVHAAVSDFAAATKLAAVDLNQLECPDTANVLAAASDDVTLASHALLTEIAVHGPESAQVTSARKSLTFAVGCYNDAADRARSIVGQKQASKRLASTLAKHKKVFQRLSKATDLEAIDEATDEFCQSADSAALTLRGLGCGNAADQLAALAPIVIAASRQAAAPGADQSICDRRDVLLDRWGSTLDAVQAEADGIQAQTLLGSGLAALAHAKAAALELGTTSDTRQSVDKFALAAKELEGTLRTNPDLVETADTLRLATETLLAAAKAVADLEAKGQRGTPAHVTTKASLDRAREHWLAAAATAHDDLESSAYRIAKSNATKLIESANMDAKSLIAAAHQDGDLTATCFKQSADGAIRGLEALGLGEAVHQVQRVAPRVLDAIHAVANGARSGDAAAQQAAAQEAQTAAAEWNTALGSAKDAVVSAVPSQAVLSGLSSQAVHSAQAMTRPLHAVQQLSSTSTTASSLRSNVGKLASVISGLVKAIQHEAGNTDDPAYKCKLQNALTTARSLPATDVRKVQEFITDCGALVANHGGSPFPTVGSSAAPIPGDLLTLIRASVKQLEDPNNPEIDERVEFKSAVSVMPVTVHNPVSDSLANLAAEDVVIVEEEAPELLDEEEAKANPIKAVAQELIVQASRWSHQDNDLVATVTNVSQRLHDLAEAYKTHSPQSQLSLLSSTKEIVALCGNLQKLSSQLALACTDRRLRVELVAAANRLPTLSQQLKILASVRASAGPSDGDSERQLVTVAQNLMAVVKDILVKSEAASIRVNQAVVAGNVGLAMIKFRRNLFKGRARRAAEASASAVNGGNDSSTVAAKEAASTSKPKVSGGFKGLVAGAVARGGTGAESGNQQQAQAASPSQAAEKVKLAAIPTVAATKPKGAFGSLVSAVKSSHPPSSTPPATPASGNAGIATSSSASSASASASPSKSPTGAPATGPSLAKRTKSSETFNPASLLSAPPKPPSRPGA